MAQDDDNETEQRNKAAFASFVTALPYRKLSQRLSELLPPAPKIPPARVYRDAARQGAAQEARLGKVGQAFRRWDATTVTLTVHDVLRAIEACQEAAEYAERETTIDALFERFQRARTVWVGSGKTDFRAREVCKVLFGVRQGRRPANRMRLRYAWDDFTTCEIRRPACDSLVGLEWTRKTWADMQLEPPADAPATERIVASLHRLTKTKRRPYAVRVIHRLFALHSEGACLQALYRAGIRDLPAMRSR